MKKTFMVACLAGLLFSACTTENQVIRQIGESDNNASEFALAPDDYQQYIASDFGWEDKFFVIGELRCVKRKPVTTPIILPGFQFQQKTIKHSR